MSKPLVDKDIKVPQELIEQLLTESEIRMLKQRYIVLKLLEEGLSIRRIAQEVGVGTDTVVRICRLAESRNLKEPSQRRSNQRAKAPAPQSSTWVFGKTE
jgi:Trp operon repressor